MGGRGGGQLRGGREGSGEGEGRPLLKSKTDRRVIKNVTSAPALSRGRCCVAPHGNAGTPVLVAGGAAAGGGVTGSSTRPCKPPPTTPTCHLALSSLSPCFCQIHLFFPTFSPLTLPSSLPPSLSHSSASCYTSLSQFFFCHLGSFPHAPHAVRQAGIRNRACALVFFLPLPPYLSSFISTCFFCLRGRQDGGVTGGQSGRRGVWGVG